MGIDPAAYRDLFLRQRFRFPCDAPILLCYLFSEQRLFAASPFHPLLYSSHSHRRFPSSAHTICCAMVFLFAGYHFHPPHFYFAMELSFCIGHALPAFQNIFSVFRFPRQSLCAFFLFAPKIALKKRRRSRVFREHSIFLYRLRCILALRGNFWLTGHAVFAAAILSAAVKSDAGMQYFCRTLLSQSPPCQNHEIYLQYTYLL